MRQPVIKAIIKLYSKITLKNTKQQLGKQWKTTKNKKAT